MRRLLIWFAIGTAMSVPATAQKADFTGTWKLDLSRSFMAGEHPPSDYELTKTLEQRGDRFTQTDTSVHLALMNMALPDSRTVTTFAADGKEYDAEAPGMFPGMPPTKLKVTAAWQGQTLLVTEKSRSSGSISTTYRRYFLSQDRSELIELLEGHNNFGDTEERLVFVRLTSPKVN